MAATYNNLGRRVSMPVEVRDASAGTVMFGVDSAVASALLPDGAFEIVETSPGQAQLNLAVIDYRDNDLGDYHEVGVTLFVRPRGSTETGTYIHRLPVNQEFTCVAGREIWGFPKSVEDIDFVYAADSVTCTLRMDGELVLRLTVPRGGDMEIPPMALTSYTYLDGVPHATSFTQGGTGARVAMDGDGVVLELGDHPVAKELRTLGLPSTPMLTTWMEHMRGTFAAAVPLR